MSLLPHLSRGDVILLPVTFVSGPGVKVRPAVVVQGDTQNRKLISTIIAVITSNNLRSQLEPTQLFIDLATLEGQQTGLLHDSTVKCEHLATIDRRDIIRVIGSFSPTLLRYLDACLLSALELKRQ
jgi:mRNA interferase MazF